MRVLYRRSSEDEGAKTVVRKTAREHVWELIVVEELEWWHAGPSKKEPRSDWLELILRLAKARGPVLADTGTSDRPYWTDLRQAEIITLHRPGAKGPSADGGFHCRRSYTFNV